MNQYQKSEKLPLIKILAMCFISASVTILFYIAALSAKIFTSTIPNIAVFCIAGTFGIGLTQLGFMLFYSKKTYGHWGIKSVLGLQTKLSAKEFLLWVPVLLFITAGLFICFQPIGTLIQKYIFAWIPDWYVFETDMSQYSRPAVGVTLGLVFVGTSLIVPIIEELFFRGFLLPRMTWLGKWAVLLNVIIFAGYHFWSPWQIVVRIVALTPFYYVVKKKDSLMLAICVHCSINIISDVLVPGIMYYLQ